MRNKKSKALQRVVLLIKKAQNLLNNRVTRKSMLGDEYPGVNDEKFIGLKSACLSFINNIYGSEHIYYQAFYNATRKSEPNAVKKIIEILNSIKEEAETGWLSKYKEIISAEFFSDFLEMAEHLLDNDYKDPAAVIIGSVLEEHLRQLSKANNIEIEIVSGGKTRTKKASTLNADLGKISYNKLDEKAVTAWLDLRNKAAHGKYNEYTKEQVMNMYNGVLDFITRNNSS